MNNLSFSNKFSPQHDNGERTLYWVDFKVKKPPTLGWYLVTRVDDSNNLFHVEAAFFTAHGNFIKDVDTNIIDGSIIAWMKLPTPYKPD